MDLWSAVRESFSIKIITSEPMRISLAFLYSREWRETKIWLGEDLLLIYVLIEFVRRAAFKIILKRLKWSGNVGI